MSGFASDFTTLDQQIEMAETLTSGTYTIRISNDFAYTSAIEAIKLQSACR